jgi:hypothetical protein
VSCVGARRLGGAVRVQPCQRVQPTARARRRVRDAEGAAQRGLGVGQGGLRVRVGGRLQSARVGELAMLKAAAQRRCGSRPG